jgi:hypothetical protein
MSTLNTHDEMEVINNQLDSTVTKNMITAETSCCKTRHESEWSAAIHTCSIMCKYWQNFFKGANNNIEVKSQLESLYDIMCKFWQKIFKGVKNNVEVKSQLESLYDKLPNNKKEQLLHQIQNKSK